jgi:ligand-binding sensor domain-containing protein
MKNLLLFIFIGFIIPISIIHAEFLWKPTGNMKGAKVTAMLKDPDGNFYSAHNKFGVYKISNGKSSICFNPYEVDSKHLILADNGNIIIGTYSGFYSTSDNGLNWVPFVFNRNVLDLIKSEDGTLYSCTGVDYDSGWRGTIYWSKNNGENWFPFKDFMNTPSAIESIGDSTVIVTTRGEGVAYTTNKGIKWHTKNQKLDGKIYSDILVNDKGMIFIIEESSSGLRRIYRAKDLNSKWELVVETEKNFTSFSQMSNGDLILLYNSNQYLKSSDDGISWITDDIGHAENLNSFYSDNDGLNYIGTEEGRIYVLDESTGKWIGYATCANEVYSIRVDKSGRVWCGTKGQILVNEDGSVSSSYMEKHKYSNKYFDLIEMDDQNNVYFSPYCCALTLRYDDNSDKFDELPFLAYALHLSSDNKMIAATYDALKYSTDYGENWILFESTEDKIATIDYITSEDDGLILAAKQTAIFSSNDYGDSWNQIDANIKVEYCSDLLMDNKGDIYHASEVYGISKSTDRGLTWTYVNNGLNHTGINDLLLHPEGYIFAATSGGGVYISYDDAKSWHQISEGISCNDVYCLDIDKEGNILAGTLGSGIFYLKIEPTSVELDKTESGFIHKNPMSADDPISFYSDIPGSKTISLYNQRGEKIETLYSDYMNSSSLSLSLSNLRLQSGMYLLRVESDKESHTHRIIILN